MKKGHITIGTTIATASGILAFAGSIIAPTLYVGDIKETNATQEVKIGNLEAAVAEFSKDSKEIKEEQKRQGESIVKIQAYFDYGIADRLQLDRERIIKGAAQIASSTNR